jgi:hypothetical protein
VVGQGRVHRFLLLQTVLPLFLRFGSHAGVLRRHGPGLVQGGIKFYVSDKADEAQTKAAVELLPTFDEFFAIDNVLEVQNVPITVEREGEQIKVSVPNSMIEIEVMKGKNGKPIKIDNLPWTGFPGPPLLDHTQYKSVVLKHEGGEEAFEHSGTNGVTARFDTDSEAGE